MASVGYVLFYWSTLELAISEAIAEAKARAGEPRSRVCGTFAERLDSWCAVATGLPQNKNKAHLIAKIREQALSLRKVRNTIVHGLMAGSSMPNEGTAYVVCTMGGYDNPAGETVEYSIDDLDHLSQALDACRRALQDLDAFNYPLDKRFQIG